MIFAGIFGAMGFLVFILSFWLNSNNFKKIHFDLGFYWFCASMSLCFVSGFYNNLSVLELKNIEKSKNLRIRHKRVIENEVVKSKQEPLALSEIY